MVTGVVFFEVSAPLYGQYASVRPSFTPAVEEGYLYGDPSRVYPDPYVPPQPFEPARGTSIPVPNRDIRMKQRAERFPALRNRFAAGSAAGAMSGSGLGSPQTRNSGATWVSPTHPMAGGQFPEPTLPVAELREVADMREEGAPEDAALQALLPVEMPSRAEPEVILLEDPEPAPFEELILPPPPEEVRVEPARQSGAEVAPRPFLPGNGAGSRRVAYPTRKKTELKPVPEVRDTTPVHSTPVRSTSVNSAPAPARPAAPMSVKVIEMGGETVRPVVRTWAPTDEGANLDVRPGSSLTREPDAGDVPRYQTPPPIFQPNAAQPLTVPERVVFHEYGRKTTIDSGSLPWYARYIRPMEVHEAQLFNILRTSEKEDTGKYSLMEACIIASHPANGDVANRLINQYYVVEQKLVSLISPHDTEMQRAEKILRFMHAEVLTGGYQLELTTIANLFENGRYNCVTATILYCCLGRRVGLNVTATELPGHAMCWVYLKDGQRMDVETTCKTWFQYRNEPATRNRVICDLIRQANANLPESVPEDVLLSNIHPITDKRLIAKVYYNRGVDLLAQRDFAGALEANAIAYLLDPNSDTTHGNLLATMNNWAISLCQEERYAEASLLLGVGIEREPKYYTFRNNHVHVYHRWVESLYRQGHLEEALEVVQRARGEQPHEEHFVKLYTQVQEGIVASRQAVLQ